MAERKTIYLDDAIDAIRKDMYADRDYMSAAICDGIEDVLNSLPSALPEPHYCKDCNWSRCHIYVDKHGKSETYWRCLNWDGETDEEGYCHEWERREG